MYSKKIKSLIFLIILALPNLLIASEVKICDDKDEWAPFSYFERINGVADKTKLTGAVTDILEEIFKIVDLNYSIDMIPWKRCTSLVDKYDKTKKYEIFINGVYTDERAEKYYLSDVLYTTSMNIFYSSRKHPNGIIQNNKFDINKYKLCDVHGFATVHYYRDFGLNKDKKIDQGAKTFVAVLKKINIGRCDICIASKEPIYGGIATGKYVIPKYIKNTILPNSKKQSFHIFIAKTSPRGKELLEKINKAIKILKDKGIYDKIFNKYLPKG